ncbi:MAG: hypothetical protein WDA25_09860, partial [Paracoccaceae bacterium]
MGRVLKPLAIVAAVAINVIPGAGQAISGAILGTTLASTAVVTGVTVGGLFAGVATAGLLAYGAPGARSPNAGLPDLQRRQLTAEDDPARKMVLGRTAAASDMVYSEPSGTDQEYVDYIVHLASHQLTSVVEVRIDDKVAWRPSTGALGEFAGYLWITPILQGGAAAYHTVNSGAHWGSAQRFTGCASLKVRVKRSGNSKKTASPFAAGISTQFLTVVEGMPVYDPRRDSTRGGSGSHRADDQASWEFVASDGERIGENLALQALAWLLGWRINGVLSVGCGVQPDEIDMPVFATSANACAEAVALAAGGTQPRYHGAGLRHDFEDPGMVRQMFADACNGEWRIVDGRIGLHVAVNDLAGPLFEITDDDVISDGTQWVPHPHAEQAINVLTGRIAQPALPANYGLVSLPPARIASLDGMDRTAPLNLGMVEDGSRGQRILKQALQRQQYQGVLSFTMGFRAWRLRLGQPVRVTLASRGWTNELFRVQRLDFDVMSGATAIELRQEHESIYQWDRDEAPMPTPGAPVFYDPQNNPYLSSPPWSEIVDDGGKPEDGATRNVNRGAHSTAIAYDAGDIVRNAAGDEIYSAVQDVPTGIALSNTAYWSLWLTSGGGAPGINSATVYLYQRTASASPPAVPGATLTYNFATQGLSGGLGSWSRSLPASGGAYRWMTSASAASAAATDDIASSEWAAPALIGESAPNVDTVILYQRGATAPALPGVTLTYTFATRALSGGSLGGWSQSIPDADAAGHPLWVTTASALSVSTTDSILPGEWAAPAQLARDGQTIRDGLVEYFDNYAAIADVQRYWTITDGASGPATVSLMAGNGYAGGMRVQATGRVAIVGRQRIAYDSEDLYRVRARCYIETVGSGNQIFVGVAAYDYTGAALPSDAGTYHYFAAGAQSITSTGWLDVEGYFRGTALVGAGNNVGRPAPDPSSPRPMANGAASMAGVFLGNYAGTGGKLSLDSLIVEKVEDLTPLPPRAWVTGVLQQKGQVVTFGGRTWIARVANTGVQPPSTGTGNATWALMADKLLTDGSTLGEVGGVIGVNPGGINTAEVAVNAVN